MANMQKYTRGACGHLCKHFERGLNKNGEPIKYGNENIDLSRSHLNYNLAPERKSQYAFIKQRTEELKCLKRKDVNVMCAWVVTVPKDLPEDEHKAFFKATYDFLEKRYGRENVISSYVHMDETTPHMHFALVPVVFDKEKNKEKVSAKLLFNKNELKNFHPELQAFVSKELGHTVNIMTGELSNRPELTLPQYKTLKEVENTLENLPQKVKQVDEILNKIAMQKTPKIDDFKTSVLSGNITISKEKLISLLEKSDALSNLTILTDLAATFNDFPDKVKLTALQEENENLLEEVGLLREDNERLKELSQKAYDKGYSDRLSDIVFNDNKPVEKAKTLSAFDDLDIDRL